MKNRLFIWNLLPIDNRPVSNYGTKSTLTTEKILSLYHWKRLCGILIEIEAIKIDPNSHLHFDSFQKCLSNKLRIIRQILCKYVYTQLLMVKCQYTIYCMLPDSVGLDLARLTCVFFVNFGVFFATHSCFLCKLHVVSLRLDICVPMYYLL